MGRKAFAMAFLRCDVMSKELEMQTSLCVVLPDEGALKDAPVVYLLHGLSDNCSCWQRYTAAENYAREYGAVLVMPEVQRSFYTDMAQGLRYFSYVHDELPALCARMFGVTNDPAKTYVMGLSMGGYGALKCALTSPERYAGCAAFSAVTDLRAAMADPGHDEHFMREMTAVFGGPLPEKDDIFLLAKDCAAHKKALPLFLACGEQDALYPVNEKLRDTLRRAEWPLEWRSWAGIHDWYFWNEALRQALAYFLGK